MNKADFDFHNDKITTYRIDMGNLQPSHVDWSWVFQACTRYGSHTKTLVCGERAERQLNDMYKKYIFRADGKAVINTAFGEFTIESAPWMDEDKVLVYDKKASVVENEKAFGVVTNIGPEGA